MIAKWSEHLVFPVLCCNPGVRTGTEVGVYTTAGTEVKL